MNQMSPNALSNCDPTRKHPKSRFGECDGCPLFASAVCQSFRDALPCDGSRIRIRRNRRGRVAVDQDEIPGFIGVLRKGYLRQERLRLNGDHVTFGLVCPGDIIGGLPGVVANCASEAATDVEICTLDSAILERLVQQNQRFRHTFIREANRQHQRLLKAAWQLNALGSRERIIAFLVDATKLMPTEVSPDGSCILHVEVSRRDWADLTNTTVETISRTIRYLSEKDLVTSLTPYRFHIRDLDRLAYLAGIDPPKRARARDESHKLLENQCASLESSGCMTTVNAPNLTSDRVGSIRKKMSALGRGHVGRRSHHGQEEIRN